MLDQRPPDPPGLPAATTRSHPWATPPILIVDDDELSRLLVDATFQAMHLVNPRWHAQDGEQAVEQLAQCARGEFALPALVVLDGNMPGRSGQQVLTWMREQPALAQVPVVMLTGVSDIESIRAAYEHSVSSYLVKPVAFDALADVIRGLPAPWMML